MELLDWVALHAAGVKGRARSLVSESAILQGRVGSKRFDVAEAQGRAALLKPFIARGGRVLGGGNAASLGPLVGRAGEPLCAYARGGLDLAAPAHRVAIVGARHPSDRGLHWARALAREIAAAGGTVVSGGAMGIDRAAHEAALAAGGVTIAVLGDPVGTRGVDERPAWMRAAFDAASNRALSLTTFGPWIPQSKRLFVARNHTIAAMADKVVIVEGRSGSGTLYTAAAAQKLGLPLFAIAGDTETSAAPNALLVSHDATLLDVTLGAAQLIGDAAASVGPSAAPELEDADEPALVRAIRGAGGRMLVDEAARTLGLSPREVLAEAGLLEMEGILSREGACLVCRRDVS